MSETPDDYGELPEADTAPDETPEVLEVEPGDIEELRDEDDG